MCGMTEHIELSALIPMPEDSHMCVVSRPIYTVKSTDVVSDKERMTIKCILAPPPSLSVAPDAEAHEDGGRKDCAHGYGDAGKGKAG